MNDIMPNRKVSIGPLSTIISYKHIEDEYIPYSGYYIVEIEVWVNSRLIRKERIVTDNLNISYKDVGD